MAVAAVVCSACLCAVAWAHPEAADALTFGDVPKGHWARSHINWVTNQKVGGKRLLADYGTSKFRPSRSLTRGQLARVLVRALRRQNDTFTPIEIPDVPTTHPYYREIQIALKLRLMGRFADGFRPGQAPLLWQFHRSLVRAVQIKFPKEDWTMLSSLDPKNWEPNAGWKTGAPRYFATEVAARYLGLRYNHPSAQDKRELSPTDRVPRDAAAYSVYQLLHMSQWRVYSLRTFNKVRFPRLSDRQKQILKFAFKYVGYPHIYGGEYPTVDSPYGRQAHGGFDCSGFDWWVMKITFDYPISVYQRSAAQMASAAKPRITRAKLQACDLIFFGPKGPKSTVASIYHAGLYIGNGWFIHSTGSTAGVSLGSISWTGWSWKTDFAWGRRVLKKAELPTAE